MESTFPDGFPGRRVQMMQFGCRWTLYRGFIAASIEI
jgi:hypothetical protein